MDELASRVRALEAERMRPAPPRRRITPSALMELMELLGDEDDGQAGEASGENPVAEAGGFPVGEPG